LLFVDIVNVNTMVMFFVLGSVLEGAFGGGGEGLFFFPKLSKL